MTQPIALLLSIASEALVAALLVAALRWGSSPRAALAAALGTLVTHWPAWHAMVALMDPIGYVPTVAGVETLVILAETVGYRVIGLQPWSRAFGLSLVANAASIGLGLALYALEWA